MTPPGSRIRFACLAVLIMAMAGSGAALVLFDRARPGESLDGLAPLLRARRLDEAEERLRAFLRRNPDSVQGNILMAQVALDREDQKPELALAHLGRVRMADRATLAIVRLNEGKAHSSQGRNDRAESAWKEALRLDPRVPEAGWDLLGLYYVQGRRADARRLAMSLFPVEPDPRDRAQLLLELVRQDAQPIGADSIIKTFEQQAHDHPEDFHTAIAVGLALIRNGRPEEGLPILRAAVERHGDDADTWDALLQGLDEARRTEELAEALEKVPAGLAADIRFERHRAVIAQEHRDWPKAADAYLLAWKWDPSDFRVLYRLSRALQAAGRTDEARAFDQRVRAAQEARDQVLPLYREADAVKTLGIAPHSDLYHRLADLRERMGRLDESLAWHGLALRDRPDDPISVAAVARLRAAIASETVSRR